MSGDILRGLSVAYVDDMVRTGDKKFKELAKQTAQKFDMADDDVPPCTFTGFRLEKGPDGNLALHQDEYIKKLPMLNAESIFSDFSSIRQKFAWLSQSRPDVLFEVSQLSQIWLRFNFSFLNKKMCIFSQARGCSANILVND